MKKLRNIIVTPYCLYLPLKNKRYNKEVIPEKNCPNDRWFYFSKTGQRRTVFKDGTIWTTVIDEDGWPTMQLQRVR